MGSNSITSDNSNIFLIDDESISLYFDFLTNKSDSEDEKDSEEIKEVSLKERNSNKKPKSNIGGNEIIKIPVTFEWENENQIEEEKNNKILEDNIYIEPVRNAEIQIIKDCNEILVEGITNKRGIMKYVVDKNENNLLIKISKTGYYRVERVFKRNNNMKENEKGNYECTMTFILVKIERLNELNKILFVSYSNTLKKIFEFDIQNIDEEKNKCQEKDMQEINGIFMAVFNYEEKKENVEVNKDEKEGIKLYRVKIKEKNNEIEKQKKKD